MEDIDKHQSRQGTILYVEDNPSNVELVEEILSMQFEGVKLITCTYEGCCKPCS